MGIGELAGLATAAVWAAASLLYGRSRLNAWQINMAKNVIAGSIFFLQILTLGLLRGDLGLQGTWTSVGWLLVSGVIGVTVGDTFYLRSLQILGPRLALIVSTAAPAFGGILGWLVLGRPVTALLWVGMMTTVTGVIWVVSKSKDHSESPGLYPGRLATGVAMGLLSALCQALGGVASILGMGPDGCTPLEASFVRISMAALVMMLLTPQLVVPTFRRVISADLRLKLIPAVVLGTWLGIWFSQIAFNYSHVAIALTLQSTTPLFVLPMVWYFDSQRITYTVIAGTCMAVLGVALTVSVPVEAVDDSAKPKAGSESHMRSESHSILE